ncbi:glycosyltransferase family 2 protein [Thiocapsa imhoffii]|nr:glycosyltransferase [Thiocapsa imhoffii]
MSDPSVSVVMGVYNGAADLERTLESVLAQEEVDLEFVVVDDGSTDATPSILEQYARRDPRLHVLSQANAGLTSALIRGCDYARGEFIARQDAGGDLSLPGRFAQQLLRLRLRQDCVLVSTGTRMVGPSEEFLFDAVLTEADLRNGLATLQVPGIRGPCHGSVMFRADAYRRVGGYRHPFIVAQDMDLWLRLAERGEMTALSEVLYRSRQSAGGISHRMGSRQFEFGELAVEAARCRRAGQPEPPLPEGRWTPTKENGRSRRSEVAHFHYFVGSCVAARDPQLARQHFVKALRARPLHLRALLRLLRPRGYRNDAE